MKTPDRISQLVRISPDRASYDAVDPIANKFVAVTPKYVGIYLGPTTRLGTTLRVETALFPQGILAFAKGVLVPVE